MKHQTTPIIVKSAAAIFLALSSPGSSIAADFTGTCTVALESGNGEWIARRTIDQNGKLPTGSRDEFRWEPISEIEFEDGMTLRWDMHYRWPAEISDQKKIPENEVTVMLWIFIEPQFPHQDMRKPQRTWFHLYRSAELEEKRGFSYNSMIDTMLWGGNDKRMDSKALFPLDHILSFGAGFDQLVWNIRTEPNAYGGSGLVAKGMLPISEMRNKVSMIPKLRKMLDAKAKRFKDECQMGPLPVAPMTSN